jgi:tetraacyldisaccharide 4'-kinase
MVIAPTGGLRTRVAAWVVAQWRGPATGPGARLLRPLSWLYAGLADGHAALYRLGLLRRHRAPAPLLVVGNLVAGGAGKTPAVIAIVQLLRAQGWTPGVISRGHGRHDRALRHVSPHSPATEVGDEPLLIHLRTGAPMVVAADRVAAARALCTAHPAVDILLSDDGLQHHRLQHPMAVWVFDERGAGNGLRLPAGPLRERLPLAVPAQVRVLYNAPAASTPLPGHRGLRRLSGVLPLASWWQGQTAPADGGWPALRGRPLLAAAGLARPEPFFAMLRAQGLRIEPLPLPDHHAFALLPWPADTAEVVVTEKDAVKLPPSSVGATRVWVATLDFQPEPGFAEALRTLCAPYRRPP